MQGPRANRCPPVPRGLVDRLRAVLEQPDARLLPFMRHQAAAGRDCGLHTVWIMGDPFLLDRPTFGPFQRAGVDDDAACAAARPEQHQLLRSGRAQPQRGVLRSCSATCSGTRGSWRRRSLHTARPSGSSLTSPRPTATSARPWKPRRSRTRRSPNSGRRSGSHDAQTPSIQRTPCIDCRSKHQGAGCLEFPLTQTR